MSFYNKYKHGCIVISTTNIFEIKNVYKPNTVLRELKKSSLEVIIIYDIYPFDTKYGYIIETMLTCYSERLTFVYILHHYDFTDLCSWIKSYKIVNHATKFEICVSGFLPSKNDLLFESKLTYKLLPFLDKQTIVKCTTIKSCISGVKHIYENVNFSAKKCYINSFDDVLLKETIQKGIAFLHCNMSGEDKQKAIDLYNDGFICCLVTTLPLIDVKCDTYVIKGTKKYTKEGYKEYTLEDTMRCAKHLRKNGKLQILTEKTMQMYYTNKLSPKKAPSYFDCLQSNAGSATSSCSILENHLPEFVMFNLLNDIQNKGLIADMIQKTFFYNNLTRKKKDLDCNVLAESLLQDLLHNKFLRPDYTLKEEMAVFFYAQGIAYTEIITFVHNCESIEKLAEQIEKLDYKSYTQKSKKLRLYESLKANKLDKNSEFYKNYMEKVELVIRIKTIAGIELSKVMILFCQLFAKHFTYKLKEPRTNYEHFATDYAKLTIEHSKIVVEVSCLHFLIVETKDKLILESQIHTSFYTEISEDDCEIYLLNVYEYELSVILTKKDGSVTKNSKYYSILGRYSSSHAQLDKNAKLMPRPSKNKLKSKERNAQKDRPIAVKHEYLNGLCITLYTPNNAKYKL